MPAAKNPDTTLYLRQACPNRFRTIDATLVWNAKVVARPRVFANIKSSDHHPYEEFIRARWATCTGLHPFPHS